MEGGAPQSYDGCGVRGGGVGVRMSLRAFRRDRPVQSENKDKPIWENGD